MTNDLTLDDLLKTKLVVEEDVTRAVQAAVAGDRSKAYAIGNYTLDLDAAFKAHEVASKALSNPQATLAYRWNMARAAILLARPV
ncbi:hypothetical protein [Methylobacterium iners]|nr:hypothetical protein [Methylobacterium iners]